MKYWQSYNKKKCPTFKNFLKRYFRIINRAKIKNGD